ncbi:hypothetical protein EDD17DRAFT_53926 [Pisolithus thermaeus]|nr:hypothetical protein EDD17DRAFT_53926 [Pisolithus thermaeus]
MPYLTGACSHSTKNANGIQEQLEGRSVSTTRASSITGMLYDTLEKLDEPDGRCKLFSANLHEISFFLFPPVSPLKQNLQVAARRIDTDSVFGGGKLLYRMRETRPSSMTGSTRKVRKHSKIDLNRCEVRKGNAGRQFVILKGVDMHQGAGLSPGPARTVENYRLLTKNRRVPTGHFTDVQVHRKIQEALERPQIAAECGLSLVP